MRDLPTDSQDYILGTKVGWLAIPQRDNPDRAWICTGFLVGPDLFMTNSHCINDAVGRLPLEEARIFMDYYQEREVDPTRGGVTARVTAVLQEDAPKDYALLRLDKPIGNTYGWLELDTTTEVDSTQSVKIIQHPRGRSKEIVRRNSEIVDIPAGHPLEDVPFALAYLADSEGGSSGSPVFLREGTGVIAIHHSAWSRFGEPHFNAGTLMSHIVPEIAQWLPGTTASDLVVQAPQISNGYLPPGESFTLSATVRNQGAVDSTATTLRFYQSFDDIITTSDIEVGTAAVSSLASIGTSEASITLTAPVSLGTYYYGACVDPVVDEARTDNNCSTAASLTVSTSPPVHMYWTRRNPAKIQRANLNGSNVEDLVTTGLLGPAGIALDIAGGNMYWTDWITEEIRCANLDGSNVQTLVNTTVSPWGIALDVAGGKMYWTMGSIGGSDGEIQSANLDGTNVQTVVPGLQYPRYITLDVAGSKIYWTIAAAGASAIQRANLDGTNVEVIVPSVHFGLPGGVALDASRDKLYWTDWSRDEIRCANLDGSNVRTLVDTTIAPWDIAVDAAGGSMYWTTGSIGQSDGEIQSANLDGSNVRTLVRELYYSAYIALGIPQESRTIITFNPSEIPDQTFTVGNPIETLYLPIASGGTEPYTYTLEPLPAGLFFDPAVQSLSGVPTTVETTTVTYTATDATGASASLTFTIEVTETGPGPLDVNGDGQVTVVDLAIVALFYGTRVPVGVSLPADVNADGVVDLADLTAVAQGIDAAGGGINGFSLIEVEEALLAAVDLAAALGAVAGAPMGFSTPQHVLSNGTAYGNVADAFADAKHLTVSDARLGMEIPAVLKGLLELLAEMGAIPETTALLPNYPNPSIPKHGYPITWQKMRRWY